MKKIRDYFLFFIILLVNTNIFATNNTNICNITGLWVNTSPMLFSFALLQEGDSTISGGWYPYAVGCDAPLITGFIEKNGQIYLYGHPSQNAGCPIMSFTAEMSFLTCDKLLVNLSGTGMDGQFIYQRIARDIILAEPKPNSVFVITKEPKMPNVNATTMINYAKITQTSIKQTHSLPFSWYINIDHEVRPGRTIRSYIQPFSTAHKEITIDFNLLQDIAPDKNGDGVRGGKLSIMVNYETGLLAKGIFDIQGTNPGKELIETVLTDPVSRGIACTESSYRQFAAKREGGIGLPVVGESKEGGKCGVGLMQLCKPQALNNSVWNWRINIDQAMGLLNEKRKTARNAHITERERLNEERETIGLPACPMGTPPPLTLEQEDRETLRRYNCGREYRWEPRDAKDCAGQWIISPTLPEKCKDYGYVDKVLNCKIP